MWTVPDVPCGLLDGRAAEDGHSRSESSRARLHILRYILHCARMAERCSSLLPLPRLSRPRHLQWNEETANKP
ncbi:hypothetical protein NDU88_007152 [Pleurodeles waltl]|uniref:Uncharacterized protein n=1 Tax=Pleurodeles waltl TaxID=8319 RepID=A0AAV7MEB8_PLEWA|nr:hypothetical protein NDU88_007152 [Pleurodeles waltl]